MIQWISSLRLNFNDQCEIIWCIFLRMSLEWLCKISSCRITKVPPVALYRCIISRVLMCFSSIKGLQTIERWSETLFCYALYESNGLFIVICCSFAWGFLVLWLSLLWRKCMFSSNIVLRLCAPVYGNRACLKSQLLVTTIDTVCTNLVDLRWYGYYLPLHC